MKSKAYTECNIRYGNLLGCKFMYYFSYAENTEDTVNIS